MPGYSDLRTNDINSDSVGGALQCEAEGDAVVSLSTLLRPGTAASRRHQSRWRTRSALEKPRGCERRAHWLYVRDSRPGKADGVQECSFRVAACRGAR